MYFASGYCVSYILYRDRWIEMVLLNLKKILTKNWIFKENFRVPAGGVLGFRTVTDGGGSLQVLDGEVGSIFFVFLRSPFMNAP